MKRKMEDERNHKDKAGEITLLFFFFFLLLFSLLFEGAIFNQIDTLFAAASLSDVLDILGVAIPQVLTLTRIIEL